MARGKKFGKGGMMAQLQRMQEELQRTQQELAEEQVEATAGGGAVKVVMSGTQECQGVVIDPSLLAENDVEMLQDLIMLAVNQAIHNSQALAAQRLGPLTGGMSIPGLTE
jgi:hypothetical protein